MSNHRQSAYVEIDGGELRRRRKLCGRTIAEFAQACEISWGYLSQIERGSGRVSPPVFARICDALDIAPDDREQLVRVEPRAVAA